MPSLPVVVLLLVGFGWGLDRAGGGAGCVVLAVAGSGRGRRRPGPLGLSWLLWLVTGTTLVTDTTQDTGVLLLVIFRLIMGALLLLYAQRTSHDLRVSAELRAKANKPR